MTEKVIILDFDGPVTHFMSALYTGDRFALAPWTMTLLDRICQLANAKLVCSSNRAPLDQKERTIALLTKAHFNCAAHLHPDWSCSYESTIPLGHQDNDISAAIRTGNIIRWCHNHPEVTTAVAIDDLKLSIDHFVHVPDRQNGIGTNELMLICHYLNIDMNAVSRVANPDCPTIKFPAPAP